MTSRSHAAMTRKRRRRLQFSLRTLLLLMLLAACLVAWVSSEYRRGQRQHDAIRWLEGQDSIIAYNENPGEAQWRRRVFGDWFPKSIQLATLTNFTGDIAPLADLPPTEKLHLRSRQMDDHLRALLEASPLSTKETPPFDLTPLASLDSLKFLLLDDVPYQDLSPLYELKNLEAITFWGTVIPAQDLTDLQAALPQCEIKAPQPAQ